MGHGHHHDDDHRGHGDGPGHSHARLALDLTNDGIRALRIGLLGLAATALLQFGIQAFSPSAGLLADALHNSGDVFTTAALWIAFVASRRAADRKYTYGYARVEDLTGLMIVVAIFASAALALFVSVRRLVDGVDFNHIGVAMAGAAIGVVGNEAVAQYKIRVGRRIGSVALVAEGRHSRIDGFASIAALAGLAGAALGAPVADPLAGLGLAAVILWVGVKTGREVVTRLADKVDETMLEGAEAAAAGVEGVRDVHDIRARWAGRQLYIVLHASVDGDLSLRQAHAIGEEIRHAVFHDVEGVAQVDVHLDPHADTDAHNTTTHHS